MPVLNPLHLTEKEIYKLMIGSILPRPIALVSTMSKDNIVNIAPFSYFNIVSSTPPLISISIRHQNDGSKKDTYVNMDETNEFVVHIISEDILVDANATSKELPSGKSELNETNFTLGESVKVKVPLIKQSKIKMECVVEKIVPFESSDLIIGRVVMFHIDDLVYEEGRINLEALNPISRLAGNNYTTVGKVITMERPK